MSTLQFVYILQSDRYDIFWGWGPPKIGPVTLKSELGQDFCTMHLPSMFHRLVFNRSKVIMLTNKHIHRDCGEQ